MSVHKTTSRKSPWRVLFRDHAGHQRSRSFATHKQAVAFDATIKTTEPADRAPIEKTTNELLADVETPDGMLLRDWLTEWFRNYGPTWAPMTLKDRAHVASRWITPLLGDVPLANFTPRLVRRYRAAICEQGASNNRANAVVTILSAALSAAVEDGVMEMNPCRGMRRLPHHRNAIRALTPLEVEAIRYAMPTPRDKIIVSLIAYAGLRPAEVCGLTWGHIGADMILVDQSVQNAKLGPTKTRRARTVRILPVLQADLDAYGRRSDHDLVVCGDKGGFLNWNIWGKRVWRSVVPDEDVVPYALRHTFASLALHEGRSLPWIAGEMGHASATTLLDHYAHLYQEAELATRVPMNDAVRAARSTPPSAPRPAPPRR